MYIKNTQELNGLEKSVNCWDTLRALQATTQSVTTNVNAKNCRDWVISSRASEESVECSTTNEYYPERVMNRHERAPAKVVYSCFQLYRDKVLLRKVRQLIAFLNQNIYGEWGIVGLYSTVQVAHLTHEE